jgi:hypothetical protein
MGIGRTMQRAGEAAGAAFDWLRRTAARGMDTRRLWHFLGHASIVRYTAMCPEPLKDIWRSIELAAPQH